MSGFSYEGKRVVVSGGGGAGMGAAAVEGLAEMGAEIHVLDMKEPRSGDELPVGRPADPDAVAAAIEQIGGPIDALFNWRASPERRSRTST